MTSNVFLTPVSGCFVASLPPVLFATIEHCVGLCGCVFSYIWLSPQESCDGQIERGEKAGSRMQQRVHLDPPWTYIPQPAYPCTVLLARL